jgi:hypothetical protein
VEAVGEIVGDTWHLFRCQRLHPKLLQQLENQPLDRDCRREASVQFRVGVSQAQCDAVCSTPERSEVVGFQVDLKVRCMYGDPLRPLV